MIHIDTEAIARLRDRLLETGGPPSVLVTGVEAMQRSGPPVEGDEASVAQFEAVFEAMFLMLSVDGSISRAESDVLRGAMRELTSGAILPGELQKMMDRCFVGLAEEGRMKRLRAVSQVLRSEPLAAEAAFVLSAAMAFADEAIAEEERRLVDTFAAMLGIDVARANELLSQVPSRRG